MTSIAIDMVEIIHQADASGAPYRLEYVRGRLKVEASPASRHQKILKRIEASIVPTPGHDAGYGCYSLQDVLIRFHDPGESLKRPDLAVFCAEPPDVDEALDMMPSAVIEVLSLGYEEKDLGDDGASFYRAYGVLDIIVVDPRQGTARHYHTGGISVLAAPAQIALACGCQLMI